MTALAKSRDTRMKEILRSKAIPVAEDAVIHKGAGVCTNAAGYLVPASDTAALTTQGVADESVDNTGGDNGDVYCRVLVGVAEFLTEGGSAVTVADHGKPVYWLDDQTVVKAGGATNDVKAGTLENLDPERSGRAWIRTFDPTV